MVRYETDWIMQARLTEDIGVYGYVEMLAHDGARPAYGPNGPTYISGQILACFFLE